MSEIKRPLVNDKLFREELARIEAEGAPTMPPVVLPSDGVHPPASGGVQELESPWSTTAGQEEVERLHQLIRQHGLELVNDGACYRAKRQRDFMIWTLETSPLIPEERGGGDANALWEMYCRFISTD